MVQISVQEHLPVRSDGCIKNLIKTPYYSPGVLAKISERNDFGKLGFIGKGISRGAEWCKFQFRSTFQ